MRKLTFLSVVLIASFSSAADIDVNRAAEYAGKTGTVLLDVRTIKEFTAGHLVGAQFLPYKEIKKRQAELPADKSTLIVAYCTVGVRSGIAVKTLTQLGYKNAFNMTGGIEAWMNAGRPVERVAPYIDNIHK